MGAVAAARRTQASFATFLARTNPSDLSLTVFAPNLAKALAPSGRPTLEPLPSWPAGHWSWRRPGIRFGGLSWPDEPSPCSPLASGRMAGSSPIPRSGRCFPPKKRHGFVSASPACSTSRLTCAPTMPAPRWRMRPRANRQRPLSAAALTEKATAAGWKNLPTWYMVSEQDNAIPPDCERFMAKRMNANVESVSGGSHAAFIAHPDIAASLILKAIETS